MASSIAAKRSPSVPCSRKDRPMASHHRAKAHPHPAPADMKHPSSDTFRAFACSRHPYKPGRPQRYIPRSSERIRSTAASIYSLFQYGLSSWVREEDIFKRQKRHDKEQINIYSLEKNGKEGTIRFPPCQRFSTPDKPACARNE
jgi:hypothetical protein